MTKLSSLWVFTNFNESKECYIIQKYWHIFGQIPLIFYNGKGRGLKKQYILQIKVLIHQDGLDQHAGDFIKAYLI